MSQDASLNSTHVLRMIDEDLDAIYAVDAVQPSCPIDNKVQPSCPIDSKPESPDTESVLYSDIFNPNRVAPLTESDRELRSNPPQNSNSGLNAPQNSSGLNHPQNSSGLNPSQNSSGTPPQNSSGLNPPQSGLNYGWDLSRLQPDSSRAYGWDLSRIGDDKPGPWDPNRLHPGYEPGSNKQRKPSILFAESGGQSVCPVHRDLDDDDSSLNEALLTPERVRRGDGYETSDTFSDGVVSEDDVSNPNDSDPELRIKSEVPQRSLRKKSVMPLRRELEEMATRQRARPEDVPLDRSPSNSVSSLNSISSLLKEKLVMNLPRMLQRSKAPSEYKLRTFVVFLFLVISLLVGFAHALYQQKILQKEYFERLRFNREARHIRVHDLDGAPIALGYLGVGLPAAGKVYPCLEQDEKGDGSVCMEWISRARLYLKAEKNQSDLRCYRLTWLSLPDSTYDPTDCFEEGGIYGHWYGGGRTLGMSWPVELGRVEMSPFVTGYIGRQRWGATLRRYFLSSRGVAIIVDPDTSLFVSINDVVNPNKLCLQAKRDDFAYYKQSHRSPQLNYSICVSSNIKTLHSQLSEQNLYEKWSPNQVDTKEMDSLLTEPVYQIASQDQHLNESTVQNYTDNIIALGFLKQGHVLLNEHWQPHVGDLTFDTTRFATMKETIHILHRRGFRITLSVQPFIETESMNFAHTVKENMLITERGSDKRIPALTRYKSLLSAGMFDVTSNRTVQFLQTKLRSLVEEYNIDSFYLDLGTAYDLPRYYNFKRNLSNPDEYKTEFINHLIASVNISGISSAIQRPPSPVFVSLPVLPSTWESLQLIIPTALTYGIIGFPFLLPGPVGGDYSLESTDPSKESWLPDKELYIRWLQLATFLPVIRYSHLPSEYTMDKMVLDLAKNLTTLRQTKINELLLKYKTEALKTGSPIIRPLWMYDPSDQACYTVSNEFLIGEELLVAPILNPGTFERELYLPAGAWRDGIDGKQRKGPMLIPNYRVQLHEIAYFRKMADTPGPKRIKEANPTGS
ncbi:hypothetical protein M8J76_007764 [Diaphorina citri]|nr:hypothetical protein M8J75_009861 [Diaphorina citri]KAI5722395.1 hypothetical protein M8J76_007764 [Diaphorina citri]KAI5724918.1 hypothetical protein M8J77_008752 [Diaphorina citri]